jgi:hypothetical protein
MKKEDSEDTLRITQQFRSGRSMVYDLRGTAGRLTMRVSAREDDDVDTGWRIEASTGTSTDAVRVTECGATRADALREVGRSWLEKRATHDLPVFDWEAIARAMTAVRAI